MDMLNYYYKWLDSNFPSNEIKTDENKKKRKVSIESTKKTLHKKNSFSYWQDKENIPINGQIYSKSLFFMKQIFINFFKEKKNTFIEGQNKNIKKNILENKGDAESTKTIQRKTEKNDKRIPENKNKNLERKTSAEPTQKNNENTTSKQEKKINKSLFASDLLKKFQKNVKKESKSSINFGQTMS